MNEGQHIASAFDRDLEAIQTLVLKMGGLVEQSIIDSTRSLAARDEELARQVVEKDAAIDELELLIQEEVARIIALRAPTAIDLRLILAVLRISANLERIGDFSKNMAKRTRVLNQLSPVNDAGVSIKRMGKEVRRMLNSALDAYIHRDVEQSRSVIEQDQEVDFMYNSLFREFLTFMMEDPRNISACMHLHFIAKNIERMGDHVTAISEQLIYVVTGEKVDSDRTKMDITSTSHTASSPNT